MKEYVTIGIGETGLLINQLFWENLNTEHKIDPSGKYFGNQSHELEKITSFYRENSSNSYFPRTILVDHDGQTISEYLSGQFSFFYDKTMTISSNKQHVKGIFDRHDGETALEDLILSQAQKAVEACDNFGGFNFFNNLNGGCGSGMTYKLSGILKENYCAQNISAYSVILSPDLMKNPNEAYNTVLGYHSLIENVDLVYPIQYQALNKYSPGLSSQEAYLTHNATVANLAANLTSGSRFRCELGFDAEKIRTQMVLFPRLHFFAAGSIEKSLNPNEKKNEEIKKMAESLFDGTNSPISIENNQEGNFGHNHEDTFFNIAMFLRGQAPISTLSRVAANIKLNRDQKFVDWVPRSNCLGSTFTPNSKGSLSLTFLGNPRSMYKMTNRIAEKFKQNLIDKIGIQSYLDIGLDEMEFMEAESNFNDLASEYQPCYGCFDEEEYDEEEAA